MTETVLVIGSGGREHVLSWKLSKSPKVSQVYVAPGNAGTCQDKKVENVDLNVKDFNAVVKFCDDRKVSLVVVGPEDPLAAGIADTLQQHGICCFGPSAAAAQIEASKSFSKKFMERHNIPTARFQTFTCPEAATKHIKSATYKALVIKASGLSAGKGVVVAQNRDQACQAVTDILVNKKYGSAGEEVVVEEFLDGEEVSVLSFCDGDTVALMPPAQDHKQLNEGDQGPNTGGMGAICPYPQISTQELQVIEREIILKTVVGLKSEGRTYKGALYAGLMLTEDGPKVLEFNCRFGDPETQTILPLLESDLYDVCKSCVDGTLKQHQPVFSQDKHVAGVVLVSGGYPGSYPKGLAITGIDVAEKTGLQIFHAGTSLKDGSTVTSGGRVLAVIAVDRSLKTACERATEGAKFIQFQNSYFRSDIGFRVLTRNRLQVQMTYSDAGVNIETGNSLVQAIKPLAKSTTRPGCDALIGGFGALFDLKAAGFVDPVLVSGTDGVGTKLKIAQEVGRHNTIGIDLVAMCVNDILAHGAEPLFFLDYFSTGQLSVSMATDVITGITKGCKEAGCALAGGETAEMPGMYTGSEYDLAGFAVGAVERSCIIPRLDQIETGDILIGLPSSGLHSNGFSLVRKVINKLEMTYDMPCPFQRGTTLGDVLLTPTKIYVKELLPLMKEMKVKAFAHITGGGLTENVARVLPSDLAASIDANKWKIPAVFGWLADKGNINAREMSRTFNCGIGGVLVVRSEESKSVLNSLTNGGVQASVIGEICRKEDKSVTVHNLVEGLDRCWPRTPVLLQRKRVAVLISGSGTNLQALIDHTTEQNSNSSAEIVLVISNKPNVQGLTRAEKAGIATKVISHKDYKSRDDFDEALHATLMSAGIDIVCLAGFMRILTGGFVSKWHGKMLNIHPSLLPSFKGRNS
ncbi:trifunctional purine biosynthetic protein adenosine-3-like isoform X2 [Mytilus galloprovincialis]|uniref:trifunctional purine biosynthetic protein adenosine-3-like isoform X2 n=1 Tax=Mytilus galloprovincialis TaxID=29158 RepID=UPI003F7C9B2E